MSIFYTIPEVVGTKPFVFLCLLLEKQGGGEIDKTRPHFAINILVIPSGSSGLLAEIWPQSASLVYDILQSIM